MCSFVLFMKQTMNKRLDAMEAKIRTKGGNDA
jgi:hypothetical protein